MSNYKNILVALDINAQHENIIRKALTICESLDDVSLIYSSLPKTYIQPYLYGMEYNIVDDEDRMAMALEKLNDIAKAFGIRLQNVFVKLGVAADEIKEFANENNVDLIVMGTHGKTGIKLLLGSTANAVLHGAKQDVLAVRVHDEKQV